MNKKLLFAAMSLAALTACSTDDFESQQQVAEGTSPIQFEVINNSDAFTRASMNTTQHKIVWNANDGDLFTLYHGATAPTGTTAATVAGFENATYTAQAGTSGSPATLTTPSMIKAGAAVMVWPADTTFRVGTNALSITIPEVQTNIENNIPYMSDLINITAHGGAGTTNAGTGKYNEAGLNRSYPVYMRPMASQLIVKAEYNGSDATIKQLYEGATGVATGEGIVPIKVTSIDLQATTQKFTKTIAVTFVPVASYTCTSLTSTPAIQTNWNTAAPNNAWSCVAGFDRANVATTGTQVTKLTAKEDCLLAGNQGCTFLILPQADFTTADNSSAVVVNTNYGKVVIGDGTGAGSAYTAAEAGDAWYRYPSSSATLGTGETRATTAETTGDNAGKYKVYSEVKNGMMQTLNVFSKNEAPVGTGVIDGEPMGTWTTRYVKVLLNHLDMRDLHITSDQQLRDVARVWNKIGHASVTVALDGNDDEEFEISKKTIEVINEINALAGAETTPRTFSVMPCKDVPGEVCSTIVVTGGGELQDMDFILQSTSTSATVKTADVALNAGESWEWAASTTATKSLIVAPATATGISKIINRGTLNSNATATLAVYDNTATTTTAAAQMNLPFENAVTGVWNINAGDINVQFDVTNYGTVNIKSGAEYHQDAYDVSGTATKSVFTNEANTVPERFFKNDPTKTAAEKEAFVEVIGVVNNKGVFSTVSGRGTINNYGLIEHAAPGAMTFITRNQKLGTGVTTNTVFATAFNDAATSGAGTDNKMGRINLPYSNRKEDNISISAALADGFVSVTVTSADAPSSKELKATDIGDKVNYVIINSGIDAVTEMSNAIKYVEFNDKTKTTASDAIVWQAGTSSAPKTATYEGLVVLSPVNIKLYTTVQVKQAVFLGARVYVAGQLNNGTTGTAPTWNGYYGDTRTNASSMYFTFD